MRNIGRVLPCLIIILFISVDSNVAQRLRDFGVSPGILATGPLNAITDVEGVRVGHTTIIKGDSIRTGVTAILPHGGNIFRQKVPAAIHVGNGFGKLAGSTQVEELGEIETPIVLTNTLSVPEAMAAVVELTLSVAGNEQVRSVNAVVGETNDGHLNDIRGRHVTKEHVLNSIRNATTGRVEEGSVGAGTGTLCFGFKGGIGTSSRRLPESLGGYTVGVLVQTNFDGVLMIDGVPVGKLLGHHYLQKEVRPPDDGSCMIVVATDAPIISRNLKRLAMRGMLGLARTGGIASNGSGDYVIAFSTAANLRMEHNQIPRIRMNEELTNDAMSPLFLAVIEATEEAILNSLFAGKRMTGRGGINVEALPLDKVLPIMEKYGRVSR